ncbi:MAG: hypothetical protein AB7G75_24080 [Candidatus Binatia bacterium]
MVGVVLILWLLPCSAQQGNPSRSLWDYHLGQGWRVGDTGVTIGGYGSLRYEEPRSGPREVAASALSAFISWDVAARLSLFSELELEDFAVVREGREFGSRGNPFEVERLYADLAVSDALSVRVGKFLTPVGRWNLLHADPLVWTTSRPLVTFRPFSVNATGLMLQGTLPSVSPNLDFMLYGEFGEELDPDDREQPFAEAAGGRLLYHFSQTTELGVSYVNFERKAEREHRENLFGVDFLWPCRQVEVSGEWTYRFGPQHSDDTEWGLFVQGALPLVGHLFGIGRYEYFAASGPARPLHLWVVGIAFRPLPAVTLKAEYRVGHHTSPEISEGFAASAAVLF